MNGTQALPNYAGVEIDGGATSNFVGFLGFDDPLQRNLISGNLFAGVWITGSGTNDNAVSGNYIGTDSNGTISLGNGSTVVTDSIDASIGGGVVIEAGASNNLIGTTGQSADDAGQRNLISGNLADGVDIYQGGTSGNVVAGNFIGTDKTGTVALANESGNGVFVAELNVPNWIGVNTAYGDENADQANVISGNADSGVGIYFSMQSLFPGT